MQCNFEIDFLRKTIAIEKRSQTLTTELKRTTIAIDRIVALWLLEKRVTTVSIDKEKYKLVTISVPYFSDWVILQNDYLPIQGEYFLN